MGLDHIEFTMEEVVATHRDWIAGLYVNRRKSEAEIAQILSSQELIVTLEQVAKCIRDWDLPPPRTHLSLPGLEEAVPSFYTARSNQNSNASSSRNSSPNPNFTPGTFSNPKNSQTLRPPNIHLNITPIDPPDQDHYSTRPLPPIPEISSHSPIKIAKDCIHGYAPHECPEVRYGLAALPTSAPSSLDTYTKTIQLHEKIAVSLCGSPGQKEEGESSNSDSDDYAEVPNVRGQYVRAETRAGMPRIGLVQRRRYRKDSEKETERKRKRRESVGDVGAHEGKGKEKEKASS